jgi:hypothetical protein
MEAYARNVEHPPPGQAFEVDSPLVQQAITGQKALYKTNCLQKVESAHANLYSDTLSDGEKLQLLNYGMQQTTWVDYCTSQTSMNQYTMCGDSLCYARLADLQHDHVHGPMDGKYPMLGFIEQDYVGKVTHESKTISGMWCHRDWMQCGSGWIAVSVIYKLAYSPQYADINFNHFNHHFNPSWYKLSCLDGMTTNQCTQYISESTMQLVLFGASTHTYAEKAVTMHRSEASPKTKSHSRQDMVGHPSRSCI